MCLRPSILGALAAAAVVVSAQDDAEYDDMGPAAFMWPPDRVWSAAADNTSPCGSVADASNRTEFPLENGKVALVAQDDSYDIELSISYSSDPQSNDDFETLVDAKAFSELDPGHTCVPLTLPSSPSAGDNATLQVRYIADFDKPENQTFYACADIRLVELAKFATAIPCFNATEQDGDDAAGPDWDYHGEHDDDDDDDDKGSDDESNGADGGGKSSGGKGSSGLSGGAIAGIVVGVVGGLAALAAAGFFLYRKRQREASMRRQEQSARGVAWTEQPPKNPSVSTASVRMQNL